MRKWGWIFILALPACGGDGGSSSGGLPDGFLTGGLGTSKTQGYIWPAGDDDLYPFSVPAGSYVSVFMSSPSEFFNLRLYDPAFALLDADTADVAGGKGVSAVVQNAGQLTVRVDGLDGLFAHESRTPYELTVTVERRIDLRVDNLSWTPTNPSMGTPFSATTRVTNTGPLATGDVVVRFHASFNEVVGPADLLIGETTVPGFALGEFRDLSLGPYPFPAAPPGVYRVLVEARPASGEPELNEVDNVREWPGVFLTVGTPTDPYEPNDTVGVATSLASHVEGPTAVVHADAGGVDVDWYALSAGQVVSLNLTHSGSSAFYVSVHDAAGTLLAESPGDGDGEEELVYVHPGPLGDCRVRVRAPVGGGTYTLVVDP